jgi:hypothetical protein
MVLRRERARRVLLRTGDDHAAGARWTAESCDVLPWRPNHGAIERLEQSIFHPACTILLALNPSLRLLLHPGFPTNYRQ